MQEMEAVPTLTGPLLQAPPSAFADEPEASSTEAVTLMLEEISTEALMRIFDSHRSSARANQIISEASWAFWASSP